MTTKQKSYMTLAEHHAQLKAEGKWDEYVARRAEQEANREKLRNSLANAEAAVVNDLCAKGVRVDSVWDLVNTDGPYPQAIPILLEHARHDYPERVREGILRALATPSALGWWQELVAAFESNALNLPPAIRYLAAVALSGAADESVIDDVIRLANDRTFGVDRLPLLSVLQESPSPEARMLLLKLRDDPDLGKEVKRMRRFDRAKKNREKVAGT